MGEEPKYRDAEWLRARRFDDHMTNHAIAEECGVSDATISKYMNRFDIEPDPETGIGSIGGPEGEHNPRYVGTVEIECDWCGETDERRPWNANRSEHEFCSAECDAKWRSETVRGENHHQYDRVEVECSVCGTPKTVHPYYKDKVDHTFCSADCRQTWFKETFKGEDHPHWNGGYEPYYGPNFDDQREKALERDGYRCRVCGITREEHRQTRDRDLNAHHVRRLMWFKENYDAPEWYELGNAVENLVTLCDNCHRPWEDMAVYPAPPA